MKKIVYITLLSLLAIACSNQPASKFQETKESALQENLQGQIVNGIRHTDMVESLTQQQLFENISDAMVLNDTLAYDRYIGKLKNIDTLLSPNRKMEDQMLHYSLLGLACQSNSLYMMKDLIQRGANIEIGSEDEFTSYSALYYAIAGGNAEMVRILIDKKSDVNAIYGEAGLTPLVQAVKYKKYLMAEILLKSGAKVDGAGDLGFGYILYPLHEAIIQNDVEMVKLLLKYKANTKLKNQDGLDAIGVAKASGADNLISILSKY